MSLEVLRRFDRETSNTILAVTALSTTANPAIDDTGKLITKYQAEVDAVLAEIRQKLRLRENDQSSKAKASIDDFLVKALDDAVLVGGAADAALKRAAQAGRLTPAAYKVIQPDPFRNRFFPLAVRKDQVEEAIHRPDDFQHLMTDRALEGEEDVFSVFLKQYDGRRRSDPNWFLVQSYRRELEQVAQSAWRIFPSDVDLTKAEKPLAVLEAFVERFGIEVQVGDRKGKFIDVTSLPRTGDKMNFQVLVSGTSPLPDDFFFSASNRKTTEILTFSVGLVYCIDVTAYRKALIAHGWPVG
jgi:hypothetical protein